MRDILLIGPLPPPKGGVSLHIERLSRAMVATGLQHEFIDESRISKSGVTNLRRISPPTYLRMLATAEVVHIHSSNHFVRTVHTLLARAMGIKVIQTVHSARGGLVAISALKLAWRLGHHRIAVSDAIANRLGGASMVAPAFIAPAVEEEAISQELADWLDAQRHSGRTVVAFNAYNTDRINGVDIYGIDLIAEAMADAKFNQQLSWVICVSNPGPDKTSLRRLEKAISGEALVDHVKLIIGDIAFPGVLRNCDVLVRPTASDGDALSIREALWYGIPVAASDAEKRPAGTVIFKSRNVQALKQAVRAALAQGVTDANATRREFSEEVIAVYRAVLKDNRNVPAKVQG